MLNRIQLEARKALQNMQPYSPGKPIWEVQRELGITKVVKLASNENSLGASPKAIDAINKFLPEINRYPDANTTDLRLAIASQMDLSAENLIVTNGTDELIRLISEAFLEPGDEIIVPSPSFSEYTFGAHLMGAAIIESPLEKGYSYDICALRALVTDRTKIVYLCSPNNPTGTYLPGPELQQLLDSLLKRVLVVFDGAYSHYSTAEDYTDALDYVRAGYPIIVMQTFSKIFGLAGIRVGFGAAPEQIIRSILKVKEPFNVNALAQVAAAAAIADEEHVRRSREVNTLGRGQLYEAFQGFGLRYTESMSNFILVEFGSEAKLVYERLLNMGMIVRYGGVWGLPEHIRITVGTDEENSFLIEGLKSVLQDRS